ncbi:conserved hypothetical protein [Tenacibaculum ascidiaceicola]
MKKNLFILFSAICLFSCQNYESKKRVEERFLYVFNIDSLKTKMKYELTIKNNDSLTIYKYKNLIESEKNMDFKFIHKTNQLFFSGTEFKLIKKGSFSDKNLSELNFDTYILTEPLDDGNGPIFFNPEYGVLNLENGWGRNFLYLKKEEEAQFTKTIITTLKEKVFFHETYN